jgi:putative addiction module killer protein
MSNYQIEHYLTAGDHRDLYLDWLQRLRDRQTKVAVIRRVTRLDSGNFGDHKFCRDGVWELRIDVGPGDREMRSRPHDEAMADLYRSDPALAVELINGILADGDQVELLIVLRQMAQAFGGVQAVAEKAHLNPTQLYRTLSPRGNPALSSLSTILKVMGLQLAVQPLAATDQAG